MRFERIYRLFFAVESPEERWLKPWMKYLLLFLLFVGTRGMTVAIFDYRGGGITSCNSDLPGYVATAQYIMEHGHLSTEDNRLYRQFGGLPLLMATLHMFVPNLIVDGFLIVLFSALGCVFLMQYLFDDFRLSVIFSVFLPYWIACSSSIYSEAPTMLGFLVAVWVLRDCRHRPLVLFLGLLFAGYGIVIRQNFVVLLLPVVFLWAWRQAGGGFLRACGLSSVALAPLVIYLSWNWFTIHELCPQAKLDREDMRDFRLYDMNTSHYVDREFDIPFHSLEEGLTDPSEKLGKKMSVVMAVAAALLALVSLGATALRTPDTPLGVLATAFFGGLCCYLLIHVSMGVTIGYKWLDRFMSLANPVIDFALFYRRPLRWPWIVLLVIVCLLYAGSTSGGTHPFLFNK